MAQSYIFKGNSTSWSKIIYTFDGDRLYSGNSTSWSNILYTFDGHIPFPLLMMVI